MTGALAALLLAQAPLIVCGPAAVAGFAEGAPVDTWAIENRSTEAWAVARVEIALAGSAGRLVFDTAPGGGGRNVSQPFRSVGGAAALAVEPEVPDGAEVLALDFARFPAAARFLFTIDMDDRITGYGGTTVAGSEVEGARLTVTFRHADGGEATHAGLFDSQGEAVAAAPCLS